MFNLQASIKKLNPAAFLLLTILAFSSFFFLYQLGKNHLIEFDEALYAVIAKNMRATGNYLVPTLRGGVPWFDKPPLYFWLSAVFMRIFGLTALAVRLPAALLGLGTVAATFFLGKALFNTRTGALAATILTSTPGFLYYGRLGMLDVPLTFFMTTTLLFFWRGRTRPKEFLLAGLCLGLGLLTKNFLILLTVAPMATTLIMDSRQNSKKINWRYLCWGLAIAGAVSLPWHLYLFATYRQNFLGTYFLYHTFNRLGQVLEDEKAPLLWYLKVIRTQFRVWYLFLYPTLLWSLITLSKKEERRSLSLPLTAAAVIFTVFTLAQSKLIWFILPFYPFGSLLIAAFLTHLISPLSPRHQTAFFVLFFILAAFNNSQNWQKIIPPDFSEDLVAGVEASEARDAAKPLFVASYDFYVASFYNRAGMVLSLGKTDWESFAQNYPPAFYLLPLKEAETKPNLMRTTPPQRFGSYVLLEKAGELPNSPKKNP